MQITHDPGIFVKYKFTKIYKIIIYDNGLIITTKNIFTTTTKVSKLLINS